MVQPKERMKTWAYFDQHGGVYWVVGPSVEAVNAFAALQGWTKTRFNLRDFGRVE